MFGQFQLHVEILGSRELDPVAGVPVKAPAWGDGEVPGAQTGVPSPFREGSWEPARWHPVVGNGSSGPVPQWAKPRFKPPIRALPGTMLEKQAEGTIFLNLSPD